LAARFRRARAAELEKAAGDRLPFYVVTMPAGNRKQLMYDLTARLVDAESLPINLVIVSSWARTGWNVVSPNVLIDATATRHVTAWQQLRGRAIRALRSWTNECYRLILVLSGSRSEDFADRAELSEDIARVLEDTATAGAPAGVVDERLRALVYQVAPEDLRARIDAHGLASLSDEERSALAIALIKARNKVAHIYELVLAYGTTPQVTLNRRDGVRQRRKHSREI
jgi:hypothetical protein